MVEHSFDQFKHVAAQTVAFLQDQGLTPFLYGSVLLGLYAGTENTKPHDIDLAFRSRDEHDQAVRVLERHDFKRIKQMNWESDAGDMSVNTVFSTKEGISLDVSYSLGDLSLDLDPARTLELEGVHIPVLSLADLKRSYERFFEEKSDASIKLTMIKSLLRQDSSNT